MRKGFMLFHDLAEVLVALGDEKSGKLIKAMIQYSTDGTVPELESPLDIVFIQLRQQLDRDIEKYDNICERNRKNGLLGGRPRNPNNPVGNLETQNNPEKPKKANTNTNTNTKTKTNTNKGGVGEKTSKNSHTPCTDQELQDISSSLQVPFSTVASKHAEIMDIIQDGSFSKYGKTVYYTLRKWIRMGLRDGKIQKTQEAQIKEMYGLS